MDVNEALAILTSAATRWSEELGTYIIPNAEETSEEDARGYREQQDEIEDALTFVRGKAFSEVQPTSPSSTSLIPNADTADPPKTRVVACRNCGAPIYLTAATDLWCHSFSGRAPCSDLSAVAAPTIDNPGSSDTL